MCVPLSPDARTADGRIDVRVVADRLGVRLPSLYKHIGSLDELRRGIGLLALSELRDLLGSAAIGRAGPDALREVALAYGAYARAHPGRYAATIAAPGPGEDERAALAERILQIVFAVLAGYGLAGDDAGQPYMALSPWRRAAGLVCHRTLPSVTSASSAHSMKASRAGR